MNENLTSVADTVANVAVAEAYSTAAISLTAVAAGAAPAATSNAKCRIMFKTAELSHNRDENRKGRLIFIFSIII